MQYEGFLILHSSSTCVMERRLLESLLRSGKNFIENISIHGFGYWLNSGKNKFEGYMIGSIFDVCYSYCRHQASDFSRALVLDLGHSSELRGLSEDPSRRSPHMASEPDMYENHSFSSVRTFLTLRKLCRSRRSPCPPPTSLTPRSPCASSRPASTPPST